MPLFAITNAAVTFEVSALGNSLSGSIAAGLILGKPLGILVFTYLAVLTGLGRLPVRCSMGPSCLEGGVLAALDLPCPFFVASLSFDNPANLASAKIGIFLGSVISALLGIVILSVVLPKAIEPHDSC